MAVASATIKGVTNVSKSFQMHGTREAWLLTCDFGSYTGSGDTMSIASVGAAIDARCRDGKSSTLRGAVPAFAGYDGTQAVYATGASAQALTVSSDDLTGNLSNAAGTELTSAAASSGVGVLVIVDRA